MVVRVCSYNNACVCVHLVTTFMYVHGCVFYRQLRARRVLSLFKNVALRTRRALLLYNVYGDSALLVLNGTSLNINNALLVLN